MQFSNNKVRIGYMPHSLDGNGPVDRRRGGRIVTELKKYGYDVSCYEPFSTEHFDIVILGGLRQVDSIIEDRRRRPKTFFVLDQPDAVLLSAGPHLRITSRLMVGFRMIAGKNFGINNRYRKLIKLIGMSDLITVGSVVQAETYQKYNKNVAVIPDVMDEEYGGNIKKHSQQCPCRLVWEGFGENVLHFEVIRSALAKLTKQYDIELHVFSNATIPKYFQHSGPVVSYLESLPCKTFYTPWDKDRCANDLLTGDIGVIPIDLKNGFAAAKPANKLNTLRMIGLPVVATPTVANRSYINDGVDGFLADTPDKWVSKLATLIEDHSLRERIGLKGRERAMEEAVFEKVFSQWLSLLPLRVSTNC
jgi:glycosyltransferase involved in cell wall biosynthesis